MKQKTIDRLSTAGLIIIGILLITSITIGITYNTGLNREMHKIGCIDEGKCYCIGYDSFISVGNHEFIKCASEDKIVNAEYDGLDCYCEDTIKEVILHSKVGSWEKNNIYGGEE